MKKSFFARFSENIALYPIFRKYQHFEKNIKYHFILRLLSKSFLPIFPGCFEITLKNRFLPYAIENINILRKSCFILEKTFFVHNLVNINISRQRNHLNRVFCPFVATKKNSSFGHNSFNNNISTIGFILRSLLKYRVLPDFPKI